MSTQKVVEVDPHDLLSSIVEWSSQGFRDVSTIAEARLRVALKDTKPWGPYFLETLIHTYEEFHQTARVFIDSKELSVKEITDVGVSLYAQADRLGRMINQMERLRKQWKRVVGNGDSGRHPSLLGQ